MLTRTGTLLVGSTVEELEAPVSVISNLMYGGNARFVVAERSLVLLYLIPLQVEV